MKRLLLLTSAVFALAVSSASAGQPICPQATGAANASPVAVQNGAPFICAA